MAVKRLRTTTRSIWSSNEMRDADQGSNILIVIEKTLSFVGGGS